MRAQSIDEDTEEPGHAESMRAAVLAAVEYGILAIDQGDGRSPSVPDVLLAQARMAAISQVSLDTLLRCYLAGHALLSDFLVREAETDDCLEGAALMPLLRMQSAAFDQIVAAVADEYRRTQERPVDSVEARRAEATRRLLAGELTNTDGLSYDFDANHLGLVAIGAGALEAIRGLAVSMDRRLLAIDNDDGAVWAWLGGREAVDSAAVDRLIGDCEGPAIAIGVPAKGLFGWRLTHRQARAALPFALRGPDRLVHYPEVALVAGALESEVLVSSLREIYLAPLALERDGGERLRQTLRAYLAAERNASSAAAALGVSRQTVVNRLRSAAERIGCPLGSCAAELAVALDLEAIGRTFPR